VGAVQEPPSGTSMRIIPSCLEVRNNSPSAAMADVQIASNHVLTIFFSIRSRNDTSTRLPLASAHRAGFFDRRDGLGNAVVGLFHRGKIGGKHAPVIDVAKHKLTFQRGNAPVIGKAVVTERPSS